MRRQFSRGSGKYLIKASTGLIYQERDILHPRDERHEENRRASDLVTLSREAVERDFFSQWVTDELLGHFHRIFGNRFKVS